MLNQRFKIELCDDDFVVPRVKKRYHGPPAYKPIVFTRCDCTVSCVDMSAMVLKGQPSGKKSSICSGGTGGGDGDGSDECKSNLVQGTGINNTAALPSIRGIDISTVGQLKRRASGRTAGGDVDNESMVSDITLASHLSTSELKFVREGRRFPFFASKHVDGDLILTDDMLKLNAMTSMSYETNLMLQEKSMKEAKVLVGYQVRRNYVLIQYFSVSICVEVFIAHSLSFSFSLAASDYFAL